MKTLSVLTAMLVWLVAASSAEASWASTILLGPNAGYCQNARPGQPISRIYAKDASKCPENRNNGTTKQKPKR